MLTRQVRPHARSLCSKPGRTSPIKCRLCPHIYVSPGIAARIAFLDSDGWCPEIEIYFCEGQPTGARSYPLGLSACRLGCMQMCSRSEMHVRRRRVGNRVASGLDPHRGKRMWAGLQGKLVHQADTFQPSHSITGPGPLLFRGSDKLDVIKIVVDQRDAQSISLLNSPFRRRLPSQGHCEGWLD